MKPRTHNAVKRRFRVRLEQEQSAMDAFCDLKGPERHFHLHRSKALRSRIFRLNALLWGYDMPARMLGSLNPILL
jgi:hypothetical protein